MFIPYLHTSVQTNILTTIQGYLHPPPLTTNTSITPPQVLPPHMYHLTTTSQVLCSDMSGNITLSKETLATMITLKLPLTSVGKAVCVKMFFLGKPFATFKALKLPFTSVGEDV